MSDRVPTEAYVYQPGASHEKGFIHAVGGPGAEEISGMRMTKELARFIANLINENVKLRRAIASNGLRLG
jgi:hypothetical protein